MEKYTFTFIDVDSNTKYVLKHGCKGWGEFGVSYGREERISNVVKSYTDNWGFIKEDGDWLVNRLFTYGPNRRIKLVVEKCVDYLAGTYRKEYVGYVDMTQLEIGMGEVTVPVNSGGFFKALENKWGEDFEIDAENLCTIDGNIITETAKFVSSDGESGTFPTEFENFYFVMGCKVDNSDEISDDFFGDTDLTNILPELMVYNINQLNAYQKTILQEGMSFYRSNCRYVKKMILNGYINVHVTFSGGIDAPRAAKINRYIGELYIVYKVTSGDEFLSEDNTNLRWIHIDDCSGSSGIKKNGQRAMTNFNLLFNFRDIELENIDTLQENGGFFTLVLKFKGDAYNNNGDYLDKIKSSQSCNYEISYGGFDLSVHFEARVNENKKVSVIPAENVFRNIISKINNGRYNVNIDITMFDTVAGDDLVSSGEMLKRAEYVIRRPEGRGYVPTGTIKTSLEKFLEYCYSVYNYRFCVNYDIDNDAYTVFLAHYDDMFTDQLIDNLGDRINDFSLKLWREKLYTRIVIGHEVDDDTVNKEREFNCKFTFSTPNTEIEENELSVICPYTAYSRGVEEYLIEHYDSEDEGDNGEVFLIHGKYDGWDEFNDAKKYILNRDIAVLSGSLFPSYEWNVKYSPKRMLLSHWKEFNGYLAFEVGKMIEFKEADYNAELKSSDGDASQIVPIHHIGEVDISEIRDGVVIEKNNLPITDTRSFLPLVVNVSGAGKEWLIRKIESNRYGVIRFEYNGKEYEGHIAYENDAISINPMNEQQCDFKLLLTKY